MAEQKEIYIVISQTGTWLSRALKVITGARYNHASISLLPDLSRMYSFGRLHAYNPFFGGFVEESPYFGTFKRFYKTQIIVLPITITGEQYEHLQQLMATMVAQRKKYRYNYLGLCLAAFHICFKTRNRYYCSEFVRDILQQYNVEGAERLQAIVQPVHFLDLPYPQIYQGRLTDYSAK